MQEDSTAFAGGSGGTAAAGTSASVAGSAGSGVAAGGSAGAAGAAGSAGSGGGSAVVELGSVTITGSSPSVPLNTRTLIGPRQGEADGDETVKCSYYPSGFEGHTGPSLQILAGFWNWSYGQAQINLYDLAGAVPFTRQSTYDELLDDQELLVYAALTHDDEFDFYAYWYLYDPFVASGTAYSSCSTTVTEFSETHVKGVTDCMNLPASLTSLDYASLGTPSPMATVTVEFDCPVLPDGSDVIVDPGGGGSGDCTGVATPCSLLSSTQCSSALGCISDGDCNGVATSCYSLFDSFSCESQQGCYWSFTTDDCSGVSSSCFSQFSSFSCASQQGCYWSDGCSGAASSCSSLGAASCTLQPGCRLQ